MLKKLAFVPLLVLLALGVGSRGAEASVVNLDATFNDFSDPVSVFLLPGDYIVTPISAQFEAWSAHDGSSCDDYGNCTQGFENSYWYDVSGFPTFVGDGNLYQYSFQALANAIGSSFTMVNPGSVDFYLVDAPLFDNRGGMSLDVAAIPEPATLTLLVPGLVAAFGRRRFRRHRQQ